MSSADFEKAAADVLKLSKPPSDGEKLQLYGLYKQATEGDATGSGPGLLDLKGKAKFNAWKANTGLSKEAAKTKYVQLVQKLQVQYT